MIRLSRSVYPVKTYLNKIKEERKTLAQSNGKNISLYPLLRYTAAK